MALILEEDGELAYCTNCGKSAAILLGKDAPEGWLFFADGIERFCSETCQDEWLDAPTWFGTVDDRFSDNQYE